MLRWVLVVGSVLAALVAGIYATGMVLPSRHTAAMEGVVSRPVPDVAARIRNVRDYPSWRPGVAVQDVEDDAGAIAYVEIADGDAIAYRLTEPVRDGQFVAAITDQSLPFGGAWTITLTPQGAATQVRIQEDGEVRDPLYRFFAHFVFGYTASMRTYLKSLGAPATSIRQG